MGGRLSSAAERLVRRFVIVIPNEVVEARLLLQKGEGTDVCEGGGLYAEAAAPGGDHPL